ncbi:MAG TPA: hypothetical protein VMW73_14970 [Spirochaetia bacterium]|nr:hypothetical protein [Spirochaetia bacterium]
MFASERFRRHVNKIRKEFRTSPESEMVSQIRRGFDFCLTSIPAVMRDDIFEYLVGRFADRKTRYTDILQYTDYMGDFIDLLNLDYDEHQDPILTDDWDYVRELMNEFAGDLDMDLVNYVMELVVRKGHID